MDRRSLILGGAALIVAPAIVRFESLMPVKVFEEKLVPFWVMENGRIKQIIWTKPVHKNGHLHLPGGLTPLWSRQYKRVPENIWPASWGKEKFDKWIDVSS